jgi:flavin reductase (DIM6/NTAB) family NADH-FMN oxidoreductase RutF
MGKLVWKPGTGITPLPASNVKAPLIKESLVNIECIVREIKEIGSHHMFISEVVAVNADDTYFDSQTRIFRLNDAMPLCYLHGRYYLTGKFIGKFGFSVGKKPKKKRK